MVEHETGEVSVESLVPRMRPRFLSQKIAAKLPEKKIPSTDAYAMMRSAYEARSAEIQLRAQSAFLRTAGTVSMALKRCSLSAGSLMYVSISRLYISL